MKVRFSNSFRKQYNKSPNKIQKAFDDRLKLFLQNSFNPQLRNHQLTGKFRNYRSINITGDCRALYSTNKIGKESVIIFETLGTHSQLYK